MIPPFGCCCAGCSRSRDWQVCGEASNGVEAIEGVERFKPDVVVMDLAMPVMNGLQAGPEIAKAHPRLPMLLISVQQVSKQLAWQACSAGYRGGVTKSGGDEVLKEIEALLRHDMVFYGDDGSSGPASLFVILIRRTIVVVVDANHISERLSSLRNEVSELRVTNALHLNQKGYAALE